MFQSLFHSSDKNDYNDGNKIKSSKGSNGNTVTNEGSKKKKKEQKKRKIIQNDADDAERKHPSPPPTKKKKRESTLKEEEKGLETKHHKKQQKGPPSKEAMELSAKLKSLSIQKRIQEALDLYHHESNRFIRDEHHACIVIDCCSRCGNVEQGERIYHDLIDQQKKKRIHIQTKTALLKGYVHSGMMDKACSLYYSHDVMKNANVRTLNTLLRGCLWSAATIYYDDRRRDRYNVYGGVVSSEHVWPSSSVSTSNAQKHHHNHHHHHHHYGQKKNATMVPDLSSFEYSITLLCQALRTDEAEARTKLLEEMHEIQITPSAPSSSSPMTQAAKSITKGASHHLNNADTKISFHILKETSNQGDNGDDSNMHDNMDVLETLCVAYLALARACTLLGKHNKGREYASIAQSITFTLLSSSNNQISHNNNNNNFGGGKGGKRSWKTAGTASNHSNHGNDSSVLDQQQSRREISNRLYRQHRVHEMQSEANMIYNACKCRLLQVEENEGKEYQQKVQSMNLPFYLITRLLYFNGGGTTDLSTMESTPSSSSASYQEQPQLELLSSLWNSFGLATAMKEMHSTDNTSKKDGIPSHSKHALNHRDCNAIMDTLDFDKAQRTIDSDGYINFSHVFSTRNKDNKSSRNLQQQPTYLELGSGFGEWAVHQATNNPSCNYVAVELRADRVGQIFAKTMINDSKNHNTGDSYGQPLENLCCIGSECGHLLHHRIKKGSISKIFINHPEPPTQTFGSNSEVLASIASGHGAEPAHMLNSQTLISAMRCLDETDGELVIVTDNRWYAKLLCCTLVKVTSKAVVNDDDNDGMSLYNKKFDKQSGIRQIETFQSKKNNSRENIILYEGTPNEAINHCTIRDQTGSSYFDRLWRSGAGTHAEVEKRFIICLRRTASPCVKEEGRNGNEKHSTNLFKKKYNKKERSKKIKAKKRNPEKQRLRNEKRLQKKKSLLEQGKGA
jgi:pentatricopeptide repeat protein